MPRHPWPSALNKAALCLVLSIWVLAPTCVAESIRAGCATPLWAAEVLENLSGARNLPTPELIDKNRAGITFLDEEKLLVYEVDVNTGRLSSRESPDVSSPYRLRARVFDIHSGKVIVSKEWGTRVHGSAIQVTSGGVLVQTGELLRLYSRDFVHLQELTLPHRDADDTDIISVSASGKTVLINRYNQKFSRFDVLDGDTLNLRQRWSEAPPLRRLYSISDTGIAAADFNQEHVLFTKFGTGAWQLVVGKPKLTCVGLPALVTDSSLVIGCKGLSLISTDGNFIYQDGFGKGEALRPEIAISQNDKTVAASLDVTRGTDFWDTGKGIRLVAMYVIAYDLSLKKRSLKSGSSTCSEE